MAVDLVPSPSSAAVERDDVEPDRAQRGSSMRRVTVRRVDRVKRKPDEYGSQDVGAGVADLGTPQAWRRCAASGE